MDVKLSPDLQSKLTSAAGRRGITAEALAREAIERAVGYDDWFVREVEKGLVQVGTGDVLTHEAVGVQLDQKLRRDQTRR
jgi:predicted transcriptional regulator